MEVTSGYGQSAVESEWIFLDLHLNEAEAVKVMQRVVLKRMMGAGSEVVNLSKCVCMCVKMLLKCGSWSK